MSSSSPQPLLVRFADAPGSFAATRDTLKECAVILGISETRAVHLAINRMYADLTGGAAEFDFPEAVPQRKAPVPAPGLAAHLDSAGAAPKAKVVRRPRAKKPA